MLFGGLKWGQELFTSRILHLVGRLALILCILGAPVKGLAENTETRTESDIAADVMWSIPKAKPPKSFGQKLNSALTQMISLSRPCLSYEENRWCAFVNPNRVMVIFTFKF
jgi:hypothetical protein